MPTDSNEDAARAVMSSEGAMSKHGFLVSYPHGDHRNRRCISDQKPNPLANASFWLRRPHKHSDLNCLSWRLAVETNNLQDWTQVPQACADYVGHYMLGKQYRQDCDAVAAEAYKGDDDHGNALEYKSSERKVLVDGGYRIRGNMGDQWSDLLGSNPGDRTFKVPDPMYYIG
ncbi:hypothetical protein L1987_45269 [Smallanthus sonchifolius]|uniref:Uncharacterized protein n=1 Tax=Smallanthus sonchifolius TaxID=185202 RepID=A0ACB9GSU2_9ASTR|nr:hypothetical protein L1987_45269 [Smallanthus sonchifolius]